MKIHDKKSILDKHECENVKIGCFSRTVNVAKLSIFQFTNKK